MCLCNAHEQHEHGDYRADARARASWVASDVMFSSTLPLGRVCLCVCVCFVRNVPMCAFWRAAKNSLRNHKMAANDVDASFPPRRRRRRRRRGAIARARAFGLHTLDQGRARSLSTSKTVRPIVVRIGRTNTQCSTENLIIESQLVCTELCTNRRSIDLPTTTHGCSTNVQGMYPETKTTRLC